METTAPFSVMKADSRSVGQSANRRSFPLRNVDWPVVTLVVTVAHAAMFAAVLPPLMAEQSPMKPTVANVAIRTGAPDTVSNARARKALSLRKQNATNHKPDHEAALAQASPTANPDMQGEADIEPDYSAAYLNNPAPPYPIAARHWHLQGKVVLNVEVVETGQCGQVAVLQSSGYEVLDNAAVQTVKSWTFVPARQGGYAVTKWFKVPIIFSLKDDNK